MLFCFISEKKRNYYVTNNKASKHAGVARYKSLELSNCLVQEYLVLFVYRVPKALEAVIQTTKRAQS